MSEHDHMLSNQTKYKYSEDEYEEDEITTLIPDAEKSLSRVGNNDWCAYDVVEWKLYSWLGFTCILYFFGSRHLLQTLTIILIL